MKEPKVVIESALEREVREERKRDTDGLLQEVERIQARGARWKDTRQMLSWYYAMHDRMESAPAIDPSREVIQGGTVDRDERIHSIAYVKLALEHLRRVQGDARGLWLLWHHFRAPSETGTVRDPDGRKRVVYGNHSVGINKLYEHVGGSRDEVIREFWRAMRIVEDFALNKGWVEYRMERKGGPQQERVYRRWEEK